MFKNKYLKLNKKNIKEVLRQIMFLILQKCDDKKLLAPHHHKSFHPALNKTTQMMIFTDLAVIRKF